jgi:hypothetical protein
LRSALHGAWPQFSAEGPFLFQSSSREDNIARADSNPTARSIPLDEGGQKQVWNPLDVSIETANKFYAFGWRASLVGAFVTLIGVALLFWGTRVRDHDSETQIARLRSSTADTLERAGKLEVTAQQLRESNLGLQRDLERERTERLKLEERVKPRAIPADKREELITLLRAAPKGQVFVVPKKFDEEAEQFAKQIADALKDGGFDVPEWTGKAALGWGISGTFLLLKDLEAAPPHTFGVQTAFIKCCEMTFLAYKNDDVPDGSIVIGVSSKP